MEERHFEYREQQHDQQAQRLEDVALHDRRLFAGGFDGNDSSDRENESEEDEANSDDQQREVDYFVRLEQNVVCLVKRNVHGST